MNMLVLGFSAYMLLSPLLSQKTLNNIINTIVNMPTDVVATSILWQSFGNNQDNFTKLVQTLNGKHLIVVIHFSNEVGRDKRHKKNFMRRVNLVKYDKKLTKMNLITRFRIKRRLDAILSFMDKYPDVTFYLTLGLEDKLSDKAAKNLYKRMLKHPISARAKIVRNPRANTPSVWFPKDGLELHHYSNLHNLKPNIIINADGQEMSFIYPYRADMSPVDGKYILNKFNKSKKKGIFMFWTAASQGLINSPIEAPINRKHFYFTAKHSHDILSLAKEMVDGNK